MSSRVALAAGGVLMLMLAGCTTSQSIATRTEYARLPADRPITVYAQDKRVYQIQHHELGDSVVRGTGMVSLRGKTSPFAGPIPFRDIVAIKTDSPNNLKGLAVFGITAVFIAYLVEGPGSGPGLSVGSGIAYISPFSGAGGTSCPYVYAWDGRRYALQAEPFGTSWGRALEERTVHLLPAARAEQGEIRLRLSNEREETHYVNSIQLRAIDLGSAPGVVLDGQGSAWPVCKPMSPLLARDASGRDVLPEISATDGRMWECDAASLTPDRGYEDVLELAFAHPHGASEASLVLTAVNTSLSTALYGYLCRLVGDQAALLAHAVETDPEMIAELREYIHDASLEAFVWNGSRWQSAGVFRPEASAVTFSRALRIRVPEGAGDTLRVRLRSMADVWRIDAVSDEWGVGPPLPSSPVRMLSATGPAGEDLRGALGADDASYAILLPPDRVELAFEAVRPAAGARVAYAVAGRGYLLEWDQHAAEGNATALASQVPEEQRVEFVKALFKHREIALRPVYEQWRKARAHSSRDGRKP